MKDPVKASLDTGTTKTDTKRKTNTDENNQSAEKPKQRPNTHRRCYPSGCEAIAPPILPKVAGQRKRDRDEYMQIRSGSSTEKIKVETLLFNSFDKKDITLFDPHKWTLDLLLLMEADALKGREACQPQPIKPNHTSTQPMRDNNGEPIAHGLRGIYRTCGSSGRLLPGLVRVPSNRVGVPKPSRIRLLGPESKKNGYRVISKIPPAPQGESTLTEKGTPPNTTDTIVVNDSSQADIQNTLQSGCIKDEDLKNNEKLSADAPEFKPKTKTQNEDATRPTESTSGRSEGAYDHLVTLVEVRPRSATVPSRTVPITSTSNKTAPATNTSTRPGNPAPPTNVSTRPGIVAPSTNIATRPGIVAPSTNVSNRPGNVAPSTVSIQPSNLAPSANGRASSQRISAQQPQQTLQAIQQLQYPNPVAPNCFSNSQAWLQQLTANHPRISNYMQLVQRWNDANQVGLNVMLAKQTIWSQMQQHLNSGGLSQVSPQCICPFAALYHQFMHTPHPPSPLCESCIGTASASRLVSAPPTI